MADDPIKRAAGDVVSYCNDEASRHNGYVGFGGAVDSDLARAYSRIADEVERFADAALAALREEQR